MDIEKFLENLSAQEYAELEKYILDKKKEAYREWSEKLFENKKISGPPTNTIEYCGQDIPSEILWIEFNH